MYVFQNLFFVDFTMKFAKISLDFILITVHLNEFKSTLGAECLFITFIVLPDIFVKSSISYRYSCVFITHICSVVTEFYKILVVPNIHFLDLKFQDFKRLQQASMRFLR